MLEVNGTKYESPEEVSNCFADTLEEIMSHPETMMRKYVHTNEVQSYLNYSTTTNNTFTGSEKLSEPISAKEARDCIVECDNYKAQGTDLLVMEQFKTMFTAPKLNLEVLQKKQFDKDSETSTNGKYTSTLD